MGDAPLNASQALAEAKAQISADNPAPSGADNPSGHATDVNGTPKTNGQPDGQTGLVDDVLNPKNLPPELRPHLDNMVKAYREKTEGLSKRVQAEVAKAVEAYKQKAEQYDALAADEEVTRAVNELIQRRNAPPPNQDPAKALEEKVKTFEEKLKTSEERIQFQEQVKELETEVVAFESAVDEKTGKPLHPDFEVLAGIQIGSLSRPGGKREPYSLLRFAIETAEGETPQEKLENGYKAAKAVRDSIYEEGKKDGMGRLRQKSASASLPPSGSFSPSGVAPAAAKNGREAIQFARQGLAPAR